MLMRRNAYSVATINVCALLDDIGLSYCVAATFVAAIEATFVDATVAR